MFLERNIHASTKDARPTCGRQLPPTVANWFITHTCRVLSGNAPARGKFLHPCARPPLLLESEQLQLTRGHCGRTPRRRTWCTRPRRHRAHRRHSLTQQKLELIQSQMAQKPMLRGEVGARAWRLQRLFEYPTWSTRAGEPAPARRQWVGVHLVTCSTRAGMPAPARRR